MMGVMTADPSHRSDAVPPGRSRSLRGVFVALGALALLAGVALTFSGSAGAKGQDEARVDTAGGSPSEGASGQTGGAGNTRQGGSGGSKEKGPRFNGTTCWEDLERFNENVTLGTFREWAAPLLAAKDPLVLEYLKARLAELIGDDERRAGEVLGWAREASPVEFKLLMGGLRQSQALPKMAAQLTALGLDEKLDLGRRAGFLDELQHMPKFEPAALDKLAHFAKDASSAEAGWVTTRAIGRVMKEDFKRGGDPRPYLDKLLTIGTESLDEQVRYLALEMEMHAEVPLDKKDTDRLAKLLATEGSEDVRQVAAHDLSMSEDKTRALEIFTQNFETEKDICVRWSLFRFAARTAGKEALPTMANMAMIDPRFQANYRDFERLYASGIVDFGRIWFSLPTDDPFGCLDRHEE
jgi:hypothetical protein